MTLLTATPGTVGALVPGYYAVGTAVWLGPGTGRVAVGPNIVQQTVAPGQSFAVTTAVASQLAASDATWWEMH